MRLVKVPHINVVGGLKLFWTRITFSRLTKIYFIFSVIHCIVQVIFQVQAFLANADAASFLNSLIVEGNATDPGFAVYDHGDIRMCDTVPSTLDASSCTVVWDGHASSASASAQVDAAQPTSVSAVSTISVSTIQLESSLSAVSRVTSSVASASASASSTVSSSAALLKESLFSTSSLASLTSSAISVATPTSISKADVSDSDDSDDESDDEGQVDIIFFKRDPVLPETVIRLALTGNATVNLQGLNGLHETQLSRKCLYSLNWPLDLVDNTKREDIAFVCFQVWLLGMSLVALLNESIPHIIASLLTHILATSWGAFQIVNTGIFHKRFTMVTTQGACGINLLPDYWSRRSDAEIPSLALNCFALLVSAFLSWRLMKTFGWQTFKRVGASRTIKHVYNLVLVLSIVIQLALFFVGTSAALWIDQVYNGNIGRLTSNAKFFKAMMITVLVLLVPWLATGWIAVRQEYRVRMMLFLGVAVFVLGGWASMFIAPTFRWTYATWLFFSLMTTAAVLLTAITLGLAIACRVNFGKGLPRYLNAQEELPDFAYVYPSSEKSPVGDEEKFAFPENDTRVPTYSVTFGSGPDVPPPAQMRFAPRSMGPRFASSAASSSAAAENPFMSPTESLSGGSSPPPQYSPSAASRLRSGPPTLSFQTMSSQRPLTRQTSISSQASRSSERSNESTSSKGSRRWVIE